MISQLNKLELVRQFSTLAFHCHHFILGVFLCIPWSHDRFVHKKENIDCWKFKIQLREVMSHPNNTQQWYNSALGAHVYITVWKTQRLGV